MNKLEMKTFYRVGHISNGQGLWYDINGDKTDLIHTKFSFCTNSKLLMPFNSEIVGYLSAVDSLDDLYNWFSKEDIELLRPFGYEILQYESDDYKIIDNHYAINQINSTMIGIVYHYIEHPRYEEFTARIEISGNLDTAKSYKIINFPEIQDYMEHPRWNECIFCMEIEGHPCPNSTYAVPEDLYNEIKKEQI